MKRVFFIILALLHLFSPEIARADEIENTEEETTVNIRYTMGWSKMYYKKWNLNLLETAFKFKEQRGLFKLSFGGSKSKKHEESLVKGDLEAEIIPDFISIELPQEYEILSQTKDRLWVVQLSYEYYWSLADGQLWKIPWDFYLSAGIMGQGEFITHNKKYGWTIVIEEDQVLEDSISFPGGIESETFKFNIPGCVNFDAKLVTLRSCGIFNIKQPKNSAVTGSFSFGF
jgi:hypothetical protein